MSGILYFIVVFIFSFVRSDEITVTFVRDYFSDRRVNQVVAFACWDPDESVQFSRSTMQLDTRLSYINIRDDLVMEKILKVNYYKLGIFVDLDCPNSEIIFDQFTDQGMRYNESYWWLITTNKDSVSEQLFGRLPLNIATEMTVAIRHDDSYKLFDVYNPSSRHGASVNITFMGHWNNFDGLNVVLNQYKYKRRGDLHGLRLNVSIVLTHQPKIDIMTYLNNPIETHFDSMHRFNYALIMQLKNYYNFTTYLMKNTNWGYKINGTYNGILGDMLKGIVDISSSPFQYKTDRYDVMEFTVQAWIIKVVLIFRHPQKNDLKDVFLTPFTSDVWMLTLIVGLFIWLLLYLVVKIEQFFFYWKKPINALDTHPATETGLITMASICQQGLNDGPRMYTGRIIFLFLYIWGLLMYQFYSASVVRSLLVENPRFINTPEDLLHSNLEVGAEEIPYNHDHFEYAERPVTKQIFEKKMAINKKRTKMPYFTAHEGLKKVQQGGFALHIDTATAYKIIEETFEEHEICELAEIPLVPPRHLSTGLNRHSPFKKMITYGLRHIVERGTSERLRHVWHQRRPECPESHSSTPVPVMIEEFSSALFLLLGGCGLSLLVMLLERIIEYWRGMQSTIAEEVKQVSSYDDDNNVDQFIEIDQ